MKYAPRDNPLKEKEANINVFRLMKGWTIRELSEKSGVGQSVISALCSGNQSPLYEVGQRAGQLKTNARKICEALEADVADIFPRYVCRIVPDGIPYETGLFYSMCGSFECAQNPEDLLERKEKVYVLEELLKDLTDRERNVVILKTIYEYTLDEISGMVTAERSSASITRERVAQIYRTSLNKIRNRAVGRFPEFATTIILRRKLYRLMPYYFREVIEKEPVPRCWAFAVDVPTENPQVDGDLYKKRKKVVHTYWKYGFISTAERNNFMAILRFKRYDSW